MSLTFIVSLRRILNLPGALDVAALGFLSFFLNQASMKSLVLATAVVSVIRGLLFALRPNATLSKNQGKYFIDAILVGAALVYLLRFNSEESYTLTILCTYLALSISLENLCLLVRQAIR